MRIFFSIFVFISLSFVFTTNAISQCLTINLIKNPGLEEYTCCPNNMGMIDCANYWTQPLTESTSDYFNVCGIDSLAFPDLLPFFQQAYFETGYAGFVAFATDKYREYIQGELSEPLIKDKCYHAEFWTLRTGYGSNTAIDALSVFFSDTLPKGGSFVNSPKIPTS